jgi:hypothetical protein
MMDPKQGSKKKSGQAWGWLRQKLIPHWHALGPVVKVRKAGAQTSYRPLKAERERFGALHSPKVKIQSLKKALLSIEPVDEDLVLTFFRQRYRNQQLFSWKWSKIQLFLAEGQFLDR